MSKIGMFYCDVHRQEFPGDACPYCMQKLHEDTAPGPDGMKYNRAVMLDLIIKARDLQKRFFAGDRSVVAKAKQAEAQLDAAVNKALSEVGHTAATWEKRPPPVQQAGLGF